MNSQLKIAFICKLLGSLMRFTYFSYMLPMGVSTQVHADRISARIYKLLHKVAICIILGVQIFKGDNNILRV